MSNTLENVLTLTRDALLDFGTYINTTGCLREKVTARERQNITKTLVYLKLIKDLVVKCKDIENGEQKEGIHR